MARLRACAGLPDPAQPGAGVGASLPPWAVRRGFYCTLQGILHGVRLRKSVYSAILSALSLVSLPMAAPAPGASASAPAADAKASVAQAAPAVPASDTSRTAVRPPVSAPKADSAAAAAASPAVAAPASAPGLDSSTARSAGDTAASVPAETPAAAAAPVDGAATPAAGAEAATAAGVQDAAADSVPAAGDKPKKRKRVVRETTVNTIDELKGRYRSPKKAFFMSLLVPGLGQAYVGQHWFNYARGASYLMLDVGLILGWNHYVNTKQDRQIRNYRRFADENWSLSKYEDSIAIQSDAGKFSTRNPHRESYCEAVQSQQGVTGKARFDACKEPVAPANLVNYSAFRNEHSDRDIDTDKEGVDSIGRLRAAFPNPQSFYELIGKEVEFVNGWRDAEGIVAGDSSYTLDGKPATTPLQQEYIGKRAKANEYARMQAWFLGGMVLNHIVSALDAAFTANLHNKSLYQTEVGMLERLRFDSGMAWDGPFPRPSVTASLTF